MELVVVLIIALLILGPKRLPGAARSIGTGIREFKDSLTNAKDNVLAEATGDEDDEDDAPTTVAKPEKAAIAA